MHEHGHEHEHEHEHGHGHGGEGCCGCGHDHSHGHGEEHEAASLRSILIGGALFAVGLALEWLGGPKWALVAVLVAAYLLLGGQVLLHAAKNIRQGRVFDENFLMSVATLGAFAIGEYPEAVGVMLFYRIGEWFEDRAVERSRKQIMEAVDLRPETVLRWENGQAAEIPAGEAQVGDVLLVRPGDRIPLDGLVLEGSSRIDTSPITGESVPVGVGAGDSVVSGCVNGSGQLKIRVEKVLGESMVTRILESVERAAANKPAVDKFITRFARVYTPVVIFAALAVAVVLPFVLPDWYFFIDENYAGALPYVWGRAGVSSVFTALTFLVISCPCALVLSVPLAFFCGIGNASRKNILFKGGSAIEALSEVKCVVMDKTGTITKGNFAVQRAVPAGGSSAAELLALAAACEAASTHPIAESVTAAAREQGLAFVAAEAVEEVAGRGIAARVQGSTVLCGSRRLLEHRGVAVGARAADDHGTEVFLARDGVYVGYIVISDTLKEGAAEAVAALGRQGVAAAMLTGDDAESAKHIGAQVGIDRVYARLLPEEKLAHLQDIRRETGRVMFVGDGINDAPVLAGADVGAAMGSGADAAIEAADLVFLTGEMAAIPESIRIARSTRRVSRQNIVFALAVKLLVLAMGLLGYANLWIAAFADTGVCMLCLLNSVRILRGK